MTTDFLFDGPADAHVTLLLAHGAGAAMDSAGMNAPTTAIVAKGIRVVRFEFAYMAGRRRGERRPPPKAELVVSEYVQALADLPATTGALFIGGKSMGGRVATMAADKLYTDGRIKGVVCLGYPFHPPERPEQLRTAHLLSLQTPTLICQGTRDEFGTKDEVGGYRLSDAVEVFWLEDGDHDLRPRKTISGFSYAEHLSAVAEKIAQWTDRFAR